MKVDQDGQNGQNEKESDEILDDDYLTQLHNYLKHMKNQRKQAEQDANLLDGHLRCLRGEEEKTLKKIEVTQRKTQNKLTSLQEQEEANRRKMEFRDRKKQELEEKKLLNQQMKDNNKMNILMKQEELRKAQELDIKILKETKKSNEEIKKYLEIEDMSNKKTQADYIKSQQLIAEEKRRAIELEKKSRIKTELERKIMKEQEKIENAESKKKQLEDEEIEVMKKIKTTTQVHKASKQ